MLGGEWRRAELSDGVDRGGVLVPMMEWMMVSPGQQGTEGLSDP